MPISFLHLLLSVNVLAGCLFVTGEIITIDVEYTTRYAYPLLKLCLYARTLHDTVFLNAVIDKVLAGCNAKKLVFIPSDIKVLWEVTHSPCSIRKLLLDVWASQAAPEHAARDYYGFSGASPKTCFEIVCVQHKVSKLERIFRSCRKITTMRTCSTILSVDR